MRIVTPLLAALLLLGGGAAGGLAQAGEGDDLDLGPFVPPVGATAAHVPGTYGHWRAVAWPRHITVRDKTAPQWDGALRAVVANWEAAFPKLAFAVVEGTPATDGSCPRKRGEIVVCSFAYDEPGWNGRTAPRGDWPHIQSVVVKLDDANYPLDRFPPDSPARQALVDHEFGHAVGLAHWNREGPGNQTCMWSNRETGRPNPDPPASCPAEHDLWALGRLYGHRHR